MTIYSDTHPLVAQAYDNVGSGYGKIGDHQKALEYGEKALRIRLSIFGEDHPDIIQSYNNLGSEYGNLGDYKKALEYCTHALKIAEAIENVNIEAIMHNRLGKIYRKKNNTERAREHFQHAAELYRELGNDKEYSANIKLFRSLAIENDS